ncbi:MAG TPA: dihydrolipoamide acetyltransferase family protein [Ktedonobacteraceae bacterium]|nr:dihydrolipoamide acetyltransferase family protein [Ktedonobacteraceae bacterium]
MREFKLPDLGEGMQEAEIRRWLVKPGDMIKLDQPMVEVETDKAVVEIPSPLAGRVATIHVAEGQLAKLGALLVSFVDDTNGNAAVTENATNDATTVTKNATNGASTHLQNVPTPVAVEATPAQATISNQTAPHQRVLAAPAVRKRAFELDVDLAQVPTTQANGRVTMDDVQRYAEQRTSPAVPASMPAADHTNGTGGPLASTVASHDADAVEERQPLTGLRKRIAERMERSWRSIPHATAFEEIDGSALQALRQSLQPVAEQRGVRFTYMPLLVKLLLPVLKEFPIFNASFDEERREIVYTYVYHLGIATATPEGLLVPVLRYADQMTLMQIAQQLTHLAEGAQKRTLALPELTGSTFTLNNVGSFGGSTGTPIINYPEAAILAVGRLQEKAVVRAGSLVACPMLPLALSFDHRLIDGALAGQFLARFKALVEQPQQIMLDMV